MKALSIRQPWAWLIVNGYKDVENRTWRTKFRGRVLIHAGKTITKGDYEACVIFCSAIAYDHFVFPKDFKFPTVGELKKECGGIVGEAQITDCVSGQYHEGGSPWFNGPYGFVMNGAKRLPFRPCLGELGFFETDYQPTDASGTGSGAGVANQGGAAATALPKQNDK